MFGDSRFSTNRKRDGWLLLLAQASRLQLFQANRVHANRPALSPPAYPTKTTTTHIAKGGVRKNMELPPRPTLGAMTKAERFISYRDIEWLARDIDEAVNIQFPTFRRPIPTSLEVLKERRRGSGRGRGSPGIGTWFEAACTYTL